jgi:prophage regulatory protein
VRFIRTRQVLEMIGVCRTTLWEMVRKGAFPQPVRITERTSGYLLEAVEQWMHLRTKGLPWPPNGLQTKSGPSSGPTPLLARRGHASQELVR